MADRYIVCRAWFKWRGKMYYKGELLPENFTHHDKARSIYGSRVAIYTGEVGTPDDQDDLDNSGDTNEGGVPGTVTPPTTVNKIPAMHSSAGGHKGAVPKGINSAATKVVSVTKHTGTQKTTSN